MQVEKLLNAQDSAKYLGLHKPDFYKYIYDGTLKHVMQTGRIKLYNIADLKRIKKTLTN